MSKKRNTNRRPQTPKVGNRAMMEGMQALRFSNAATKHKPATSYNRHDKSWKKEI